jgi:hypothetical protein
MAILDNKIGTFRFVALLGNPMPPAQRVRIDDRPGFDNSEYALEGLKGEPFVVLSQVDADDYEDARALFLEYQELQGQDAVEFQQGGVSSTAQGWKVKVLMVRQERCLALAGGAVGGLTATPGAWLECRWELQAIKI